jgi:hypothetical protein
MNIAVGVVVIKTIAIQKDMEKEGAVHAKSQNQLRHKLYFIS